VGKARYYENKYKANKKINTLAIDEILKKTLCEILFNELEGEDL
jgi:hypothetical protein